ncbi:LAETG motif-containing sortase-dependent surface protein [Streptomyces niveus]|uniref:LPXTG cell wall anchor domain-containing protein n=1 Tax=Streptomyces niveus TaxID=193462 RepID=A0ABZ2A107_STRNV|nr:LAETG motif-containing sortase-dependent surface protein [Streptomyces niveus]WTA62854.1 LAETG motif-containing sortase-dependent surface protein [Streptomyces niveus]
MTVFNRSWRRPGALVTVAAASALGVGLFVAPAVAHTPAWAVTCSEVSVDLVNYTADKENTVTLTVDGKDLLPTEKFGGEFHKKIELPKHTKELSLHLVVVDGSGNDGSLNDTKTAPVCEGEPEPSTTPPTEPTPTPSEAKPEPEPEPSKTTAAAEVPSSQPSPAGDDLAETGSSSTTPLIAGAAAVILVAGAGITWAARKRRAVGN